MLFVCILDMCQVLFSFRNIWSQVEALLASTLSYYVCAPTGPFFRATRNERFYIHCFSLTDSPCITKSLLSANAARLVCLEPMVYWRWRTENSLWCRRFMTDITHPQTSLVSIAKAQHSTLSTQPLNTANYYSCHWTISRAILVQFVPTQNIPVKILYVLLFPSPSPSSKWPLLKGCSHQKLGNWNSSELYITEYEYIMCASKYTVVNLPVQKVSDWILGPDISNTAFFCGFIQSVWTLPAK